MARKKDPIPSTLVRFEGRRKKGVSPRDDKTFAWYETIPQGQKFAFAWELMTAALNGELGPTMQAAAEESDVDRARQAANEIANSFVIDDED